MTGRKPYIDDGTLGINLPPEQRRWTGTTYQHRVAVCPDCGNDLDDEGFGFWCPACQCSWPFSHVIFPEDHDDDD